MRQLLATTTFALLAATAAYGQSAGEIFNPDIEVSNTDFYASTFIGRTVYATETEVTADLRLAEDEVTAIGEVDDVLMSADGEAKGVVLGIGGFADLGEKNVMVELGDVHFVQEEGEQGEVIVVLQTTAEAVEDAPAFEYERGLGVGEG